jgi:Family of unknown function (DUF6073)
MMRVFGRRCLDSGCANTAMEVAMAGIEKWGPEIDIKGLKELYAPQEIKPFTATPAGIDNLALSSIDTFLLPNGGKYEKHEVHFEGYFQVARGAPTSREWATAEVYVNMTDLMLHAKAATKGLGPIRVRKNPDLLSAGQVFAAGGATTLASCRIAASVIFEAPERGLSFFNKEPILLMNGGIKSVPPVEDPNGKAHNYLLPLFDTKHPDGAAVAYLESLHYTVGNYLTKDAADAIRRRG